MSNQQKSILTQTGELKEQLRQATAGVAPTKAIKATINPFAKATKNYSAQAELMKADPVLAEKLRAEANPAPNPYAKESRNLTEQVKLERSDPDRAKLLKAAANPPTNPFAKATQNLTRQVELLKSDPVLAKAMQADAGCS